MIRRFIHWLILLALVLSMPACAPASAQPPATPAPTVAPTITPDAAQPLVLVLPGGREQKTLIAVNRHYSDLVKSRGWNVDFYTVQQTFNDAGEDCYVQYIIKQLSAGAARADGYFGWFGRVDDGNRPLDGIKSQGLLYNCAAAAPQAVPDYWSRFQDQIVQSPYGLPLCLSYDVHNRGVALALRKDLRGMAPQEPIDFTDVCALLGTLRQTDAPNKYLTTQFEQWKDIWAQQQGYMPLFRYCGIYTRMDDPDAQPVFLEDIPAVASFLKDTLTLREAGLLKLSYSMDPASPQPAAALDSAGMYMSAYVEQNFADYVVYPLLTEQPYSNDLFFAHTVVNRKYYNDELVIPARSRRAADAMAFVQWVYASQENAECLMYGQQGEDFTLSKDRVAFIPSRKNDEWYGHSIFGGASHSRIPVDAPENAEGLGTAWPQQRFAAPWLGHLYDNDLQIVMYDMDAGDKRLEKINTLTELMQSELPSKILDVDDWLMALRQATSEDYMEPYLDELRQARFREP